MNCAAGSQVLSSFTKGCILGYHYFFLYSLPHFEKRYSNSRCLLPVRPQAMWEQVLSTAFHPLYLKQQIFLTHWQDNHSIKSNLYLLEKKAVSEHRRLPKLPGSKNHQDQLQTWPYWCTPQVHTRAQDSLTSSLTTVGDGAELTLGMFANNTKPEVDAVLPFTGTSTGRRHEPTHESQ